MQWVYLVLLTKDRMTEVSGYNAMDTPGAVSRDTDGLSSVHCHVIALTLSHT